MKNDAYQKIYQQGTFFTNYEFILTCEFVSRICLLICKIMSFFIRKLKIIMGCTNLNVQVRCQLHLSGCTQYQADMTGAFINLYTTWGQWHKCIHKSEPHWILKSHWLSITLAVSVYMMKFNLYVLLIWCDEYVSIWETDERIIENNKSNLHWNGYITKNF